MRLAALDGTEKLRKSAQQKRLFHQQPSRMALTLNMRTRHRLQVEARLDKKRDLQDQIPKRTRAATIHVEAAPSLAFGGCNGPGEGTPRWAGAAGSAPGWPGFQMVELPQRLQ